MARSALRKSLITWLGVFAVLGQLMLPVVHAQSWGARSNDPLLAAFCGLGTPSEIAVQLRERAPSELLSALQAKAAEKAALFVGCDICASSGGHQLAMAPSTPFSLIHIGDAFAIAHQAYATPQAQPVLLPPLRGPPTLSVV